MQKMAELSFGHPLCSIINLIMVDRILPERGIGLQ